MDPFSPVLIQYEPAVQMGDGGTLQPDSRVWVEIKPPSQIRAGVVQALPLPVVVPIPSDGPLRLRLLSSNIFLNPARYRVAFYQGVGIDPPTLRRPIAQQEWVIPPVCRPSHFRLVHQAAGDYIDCSVWSVLSTPYPAGEYRIVNNHLIWVTGGPEEGEAYDVLVQPGFTLPQIIWPRPDPIHASLPQTHLHYPVI